MGIKTNIQTSLDSVFSGDAWATKWSCVSVKGLKRSPRLVLGKAILNRCRLSNPN